MPEDDSVHRLIDDQGRGDRVVAQPGDEGCRFPMAVRRVIDETLAFLAASARSRHLRICASFINKYKSVRIKRRLRPFPFLARLRHVFSMLLAGVQRFFYS